MCRGSPFSLDATCVLSRLNLGIKVGRSRRGRRILCLEIIPSDNFYKALAQQPGQRTRKPEISIGDGITCRQCFDTVQKAVPNFPAKACIYLCSATLTVSSVALPLAFSVNGVLALVVKASGMILGRASRLSCICFR